jgi:uncharacterized membrane protein
MNIVRVKSTFTYIKGLLKNHFAWQQPRPFNCVHNYIYKDLTYWTKQNIVICTYLNVLFLFLLLLLLLLLPSLSLLCKHFLLAFLVILVTTTALYIKPYKTTQQRCCQRCSCKCSSRRRGPRNESAFLVCLFHLITSRFVRLIMST